MVPITPVPLAPPYITGIINLRDEITNIIVLVSEVAEGSNLGIIVDIVHSVRKVSEDRVETMDSALCHEAFVKEIITVGGEGRDDLEEKKNLVRDLVTTA